MSLKLLHILRFLKLMADWSCITSLSLGCSGFLYYVVKCYALSAPSGGCVVAIIL
jgi:hypothetical protein